MEPLRPLAMGIVAEAINSTAGNASDAKEVSSLIGNRPFFLLLSSLLMWPVALEIPIDCCTGMQIQPGDKQSRDSTADRPIGRCTGPRAKADSRFLPALKPQSAERHQSGS